MYTESNNIGLTSLETRAKHRLELRLFFLFYTQYVNRTHRYRIFDCILYTNINVYIVIWIFVSLNRNDLTDVTSKH
jgi:hypothetical protein